MSALKKHSVDEAVDAFMARAATLANLGVDPARVVGYYTGREGLQVRTWVVVGDEVVCWHGGDLNCCDPCREADYRITEFEEDPR